ncbi:MAG: folylpolyglutamate synthase/dihydrofolate synthase family protein [Bacteroidales bacterium]|nr:folylpolyglutamate synthase/dihydrofolate synthase family protein [Bacteroidales bacterium]MDZ4205270.1 folylpolyglutamate synthase/dihydrofolate synthase family protein [Bacteroidales bacterium]
MSYKQTLDYLHSMLPMFHRIGAAAYKADLGNTIALCQLLGQPHEKFKSVHIAGTNGKGSVSHMIASVLQSAGYKTGLFTSPHLTDFRERIRINGKMIPKPVVVRFVNLWKTEFRAIQPSFFEWTVGLAFDYFGHERVDIAVLETGMGGRLDSTNIVTPALSVITNIGMDHMAFLGNTLEKIAREKAGIIKTRTPVVIGERLPETAPVFISKANEMSAPIYFADEFFSAEILGVFNPEKSGSSYNIYHKNRILHKNLSMPLAGNYQQQNLVTVFTALEVLKKKGFNISDQHITKGISGVVRRTGLRGRWQVLGKNPLIICDVGHNKDGLVQVIAQIKKLTFRQLHIVFGMVDDKDIDSMLELLPDDAIYYFCKPDIPRGLDERILVAEAAKVGLIGQSHRSVKEAYGVAIKSAHPDDLIFVGGSTFVVAEVL